MLFRAIFWMAVVALFMPHGQSVRTDVSRCQYIACSVHIDLLDRFKASGLQRLKAVRVQIEDAERARKHG
ncbi:MAG TPA: hypothetical protein VGF62_00935 [Rhizomicrobium sp.]|jgi:hypothetical protein